MSNYEEQLTLNLTEQTNGNADCNAKIETAAPVLEKQLPLGTYLARVMEATPYLRDVENYWMVVLTLEILQGAYSGFVQTKYYHLKNETASGFFIREFALLDILIEDLDFLQIACMDAIGKEISLKVQETAGSTAYYLAKPKVDKGFRLNDPKDAWPKKKN